MFTGHFLTYAITWEMFPSKIWLKSINKTHPNTFHDHLYGLMTLYFFLQYYVKEKKGKWQAKVGLYALLHALVCESVSYVLYGKLDECFLSNNFLGLVSKFGIYYNVSIRQLQIKHFLNWEEGRRQVFSKYLLQIAVDPYFCLIFILLRSMFPLYTLEKIRKPLLFLRFQGAQEGILP